MESLNVANQDSFRQAKTYTARPRLYDLMAACIPHSLIVVCAGTGYGKSHMVRSYLKQYACSATWIQVTKQNATKETFWETYVRALPSSCGEMKDKLWKLGFPHTDHAFKHYDDIMQSIAKCLNECTIVYDDFHLMQDADILLFFEKAAGTLPQGFSFILLSRIMPAFNMPRLVINNCVATVTEKDLCFTEREILAYFGQFGQIPDRETVRGILEDTKGWPFSISLIHRSMLQTGKYDAHVYETMKKNIFQLISSEIDLTSLESARRLFVRISLLNHFSGSLIQALPEGEALVKALEQVSAYVRYDFDLGIFVIHDLFLEYLRQFQDLLTEVEKRETYEKAASWCEANDELGEALSYYERSGNLHRIFQIISRLHLQAEPGLTKLAVEIFERMPEHVRLENPLFPCLYVKLKISQGSLEEVQALLEGFSATYEARPESYEKHCALTGIYSIWAIFRFILGPYTGVYDFGLYLEKQKKYFEKSRFLAFDPSAFSLTGFYALLVGSNQAEAMAEFIEAVNQGIPQFSPMSHAAFHGLDDFICGELYYYQRNLDDAETRLKQAFDKARRSDQYAIQSSVLLYLMKIEFFRGDFDAANAYLKALESLLQRKGFDSRHMIYEIACGFYELMLGRPSQVADWLKGELYSGEHPLFNSDHAQLAMMQYHYQTRQFNKLRAFIRNERDRQVLLLSKIEFEILEALTLFQLKRKKEAFSALLASYKLAKPNDIITPFIEYGKDMRTLTLAAIKHGNTDIPKTWLEEINRKSSTFAKKQANMISAHKTANSPDGVNALTLREAAILKDFSQGLSRSEVAASRNVSVNTVKMTLNTIYEKLYANNLADAIRIASNLNII